MSNDVEASTTDCPRCDGDITDQEYYGICPTCTTELRSRYDGSGAGDVEAIEYEPKMNVTPNAVALKE